MLKILKILKLFEFCINILMCPTFDCMNFDSLAASLVPSGSTVSVGFGGYVGGSRLEASLATEDSKPYLVRFPNYWKIFFSLFGLVHVFMVSAFF